MQLEKSAAHLPDILRAFNLITEKITGHEQGLGKILPDILGQLVSMLNISYASVMLLDESNIRFLPVASHGDFPLAQDLAVILDISKLVRCKTVINHGVVFTDLVNDSAWDQLKPGDREPLGKTLCTPLRIHEKVIGVACIYGEDLEHGIRESAIFSLWANLMSLAIEKFGFHNYKDSVLEELKPIQSRLFQSKKLDSLVEIAMGVGHNIRNPVTIIGGLSRRMYGDLPEDDPRRQFFRIILTEVSRLENMVDEFNRFYAIKQISFQCMDINRIVDQAADYFVSQFNDKPDFTLKCRKWDEPLMCFVDPELLERSLIQLLSNARESDVKNVEITLATSRAGRHAFIDVTDSGKGMSPKEMDRIFDPFYTTKGEGMGMGLTFVHFVICEHSGQIDIRSEKGEGTRFRIIIPLESP